jgi:hypothetical protein
VDGPRAQPLNRCVVGRESVMNCHISCELVQFISNDLRVARDRLLPGTRLLEDLDLR